MPAQGNKRIQISWNELRAQTVYEPQRSDANTTGIRNLRTLGQRRAASIRMKYGVGPEEELLGGQQAVVLRRPMRSNDATLAWTDGQVTVGHISYLLPHVPKRHGGRPPVDVRGLRCNWCSIPPGHSKVLFRGAGPYA